MLARLFLLLLACSGISAPAVAVERPVSGKRLVVRQHGSPRLEFASKDPSLRAPFADPRLGSALLLGSSAAPGQCRAEWALDPEHWSPLGGDGTLKGYRYDERGTWGRLRIVLKKHKLEVKAEGEIAGCDLSAPQSLPLRVELRVHRDRFCAAFGGKLRTKKVARFEAKGARAPAGCADADLTVANLNLLHGFACDPPVPLDGDQCRLEARLDLLVQHIQAVGCPDVVTLQENVVDDFVVTEIGNVGPLTSTVAAIEERLGGLAEACGFAYQIVFDPEGATPAGQPRGIDEELILTRYPVLSASVTPLHSALTPFFQRQMLHARVDHPVGPVDVFTSHLASGSDAGSSLCGQQILLPVACPDDCLAFVDTVRECQARQMANRIEAIHDVPTPAVITGDFNATPLSGTYDQFAGRGWIDSFLAAGNPECDPTSGAGCTSGREDSDLSELESPLSNSTRRIDYSFLVPPGEGSVCVAVLDPATDPDGDGGGTRLFADEPNPFEAPCGSEPLAICWPSDHEGSELDLNCALD